MRQYYDLMMPSVEENALALSAMKRGEVAALKQERAQNIAKGLLLREELKKTLAPMLKGDALPVKRARSGYWSRTTRSSSRPART